VLQVGNARGRAKPDPVQCFQLLQKLVVTLDRCERPEVKEFQRRCEEAVVDVLLKGAPPPVRVGQGSGMGLRLQAAHSACVTAVVEAVVREHVGPVEVLQCAVWAVACWKAHD